MTVILVTGAVVLLLLVGLAVASRRSDDRPIETLTKASLPEVITEPRSFVFVAPDRPDEALSGDIMAARESLLFGGGNEGDAGATGMPRAWNGIAQMVPTIMGALSRGEVVRITGPQHLVDGLRAGTLRSTLTSTGPIGVVKGPDGRFVGHLRFDSASEAKVPATVAGPLLLFQAASVVTMQYYLHQITTRLMDIQSGIDDLKQALSAQTAGKIRAAASMVQDLEGFLAQGVPLNADDRSKLQLAEAGVREAHEQLRENLGGFGRKVNAAVDDDDAIRPGVDKAMLKTLLTSTADDAARDALLAMEATVIRVRLMRLRAFAEMDASPERLEVVRENLERELEQLREAYDQLRPPFDRLNLRRQTVEDRWRTNAAVSELDQYRAKTRATRALIRTPPRRVLPAAAQEQPWLVELRQGPKGVESRYALLERPDADSAG